MSGSGRQMRKALDADEDAGHRNRKPWALPRQCVKLQFEAAEPNRAVMLDDCWITSHEVASGRYPLNCNLKSGILLARNALGAPAPV